MDTGYCKNLHYNSLRKKTIKSSQNKILHYEDKDQRLVYQIQVVKF